MLFNNDATIAVEIGNLAFVLALTLVALNVSNQNLMLLTGQWLPLQSLLADLETIKLVLVQI